MWPGFDSRSRCHMWVEFVVGSRPCSEGFSPGTEKRNGMYGYQVREFSHRPAWLPRLARSNCSQGRLHQGTFNNHIVLSSMNIVLQLSELRLSTVLSPPPGRDGYSLMWTILGFAARQDTVLVSVPKHGI